MGEIVSMGALLEVMTLAEGRGPEVFRKPAEDSHRDDMKRVEPFLNRFRKHFPGVAVSFIPQNQSLVFKAWFRQYEKEVLFRVAAPMLLIEAEEKRLLSWWTGVAGLVKKAMDLLGRGSIELSEHGGEFSSVGPTKEVKAVLIMLDSPEAREALEKDSGFLLSFKAMYADELQGLFDEFGFEDVKIIEHGEHILVDVREYVNGRPKGCNMSLPIREAALHYANTRKDLIYLRAIAREGFDREREDSDPGA